MTRSNRPRPVSNRRPRAVIYKRQSIAREESVSLELQETSCRDHCEREGYDVVAVETDAGVSGRKWDRRPGVQRVMAMVQAGDVDVVVVWRWSRLSRNRVHWAVAIDTIEKIGARVESATEPIDTRTAAGRFGRGVLAESNAFFSEVIGEQWLEAHERRRKLGLPAQGGDRFGYRRAGRGDEQRFEPDPEQAPVLADCYRLYLDGAGFSAIARRLTDDGLTNRLGRVWQRTAVRDMLDSGFAAGLIVHGDGEHRVYHPGAHQAVIDAETWRAYLAARQRRATTAPRVTEPRYPLTGLIRCGDCGAAMQATHGGTGRAGHSYLCGRWRVSGEGRCVTIVRSAAERAVLDWLAALASDVDAAAAADQAAKRLRSSARADAKTAARRVARLEEQLVELTRKLIAEVVPQVAYETTRDQLLAEHAAATARLADAEAVAVTQPEGTRRIARDLLGEWDELPVRARRDVLASLVARVEVHPPQRDNGAARASVRIIPRWTEPATAP